MDTPRKVQGGIFHTQRDLIALRGLQHDLYADKLADTSATFLFSSQTNQETERQLEQDTHVHKTKKLGCALQGGSDMDAAKRVMRRYLEGQLEAQRWREEQFVQQLAEKDNQIFAVHSAAATFAQKALARRLGMRVLSRWLQKTIYASVDRNRMEFKWQIQRIRDVMARQSEEFKSGRELRLRCFYRWRVKQLKAAVKMQHSRQEELEAELRRYRQEFKQHLSDERTNDVLKQDRNDAVKRELEMEILRLKTAMDEMMCEFSERTGTYLRQQEELMGYYAKRERRLAYQVVSAEEIARRHEERATQLVVTLAAQREEVENVMQVTCDAVDCCVLAKATMLHSASVTVILGEEDRVAALKVELAKKVGLVAQLNERIVLLQDRCEVLERQIEESDMTRKRQKIIARSSAETTAVLLYCKYTADLIRRVWAAWRLHAMLRGFARMQHAAHTNLEESRQQLQRLTAEWQMYTTVEKVLQEELFSRRALTDEESSARQFLCHQAVCENTETQLREEVTRLTLHVDWWKKTAKETQLRQMLENHRALLDRLNDTEHAERLSLHYDEMCVRQILFRRFDASFVAAAVQEQQKVMQVELNGAAMQIQNMGCLIVDYCAHDALNRWLLFVQRRRGQQNARQMVVMTGATSSWFSVLMELMKIMHDEKIRLFMSCVCRITSFYVSRVQQLSFDVAAAKNEVEATRTKYDTQMCINMGRYSTLWVDFTATAASWSAGRECLLMGCCLEAYTAACLQDALCIPGTAAPPPLEQAMRLLSSERRLLAEHVSDVIGGMRFTTTEALAIQKEQHEAVMKELLEYQTFLENRIVAMENVESAKCRELQEQCDVREARARQEMDEMMKRIESLQSTLERNDAHQAEERRRYGVELSALRHRLQEQKEDARQAAERARTDHERKVYELQGKIDELYKTRTEGHIALEDVLKQHERVLCAFEEDLAGRRTVFLTTANMLEEVERFSDELLLQSEDTLQQLSELRCYAGECLQQRFKAEDEVRRLQAEHEGLNAAFTQTLRTAREHSETAYRELQEQCDVREARARQEMDEMMKRIESLQSTLERNDAHQAEERRRYGVELSALRHRLQEQKEDARQAAERARTDHERKVYELQGKIDELYKTRTEGHIGVSGELESAEVRSLISGLQLEVRLVECRLQEAEKRRALEFAGIQGAWEAERWAYATAVVVRTSQSRSSDRGGRVESCQLFWDSVVRFVGAMTEAACVLYDAKNCLFVAYNAAIKRPGRRGNVNLLPVCVQPGLLQEAPVDQSFSVVRSSRRSLSTSDVANSMVRYSKLLNEQRCKNDSRLWHADNLVTQVNDLIEHSRILTRPE